MSIAIFVDELGKASKDGRLRGKCIAQIGTRTYQHIKEDIIASAKAWYSVAPSPLEPQGNYLGMLLGLKLYLVTDPDLMDLCEIVEQLV
jgi:hypothetical protein